MISAALPQVDLRCASPSWRLAGHCHADPDPDADPDPNPDLFPATFSRLGIPTDAVNPSQTDPMSTSTSSTSLGSNADDNRAHAEPSPTPRPFLHCGRDYLPCSVCVCVWEFGFGCRVHAAEAKQDMLQACVPLVADCALSYVAAASRLTHPLASPTLATLT
jgi:hypothetical protein